MTLPYSSQPSTQLDEPAEAARFFPIDAAAIRSAVIVFIFVLAMNFPFPPHSPLAGTEGHRGLTAHHMVESGQWLVPILDGRVYLAKPPLHYWLQAIAETISGTHAEFIWRVPSAVCSATMAAMLVLFAVRWFGKRAGILTGFAYAAVVSMWGMSRNADIDITNVLASNLAAICVLEIYFGTGRRVFAWIVAASIFFAATLMAKGPGGLPTLLGAMLCVAVFAVRERRWNHIILPRFWLPLILGLLAFAGYGYAVYHYLVSHHMTLDWTGLQEGAMDLHPHDWSLSRAITWIMLAPTLWAYALPASLGLIFTFNKSIRSDAVRSRRMLAVAWTVICSWIICFISGMHLPRYGYITLPLMCPLAGAVLAQVFEYPAKLQQLIWWILRVSVVLFAVATIVSAIILWPNHAVRVVAIAASVVSIAVAIYVLPGLSPTPATARPLWPAPILILCLAILASCAAHYDRKRRTGKDAGEMIASITGPNAELMAGALILDQPEVFYYSKLKPLPYGGDYVKWQDVDRSGWIVLESNNATNELKMWQEAVPQRMSKFHPFEVNRNPATLLWYDVTIPAAGATTQPDGSKP